MGYFYFCSRCLDFQVEIDVKPGRQGIPSQLITRCNLCCNQTTFWNASHDAVMIKLYQRLHDAENKINKLHLRRKNIIRVGCRSGCRCTAAIAELKGEVEALRSNGAIAVEKS